MRHLAARLALPLALSAATFAAAEARADLTAGARPLEPVLRGEETYTESFVAIADLDDGTYAKVQLGISNAGPGDHHGACRVLIVHRGEAAWTADEVVEREGWSFSASPEPTLTIGRCRAVAGERLVITAPVGGATFELTLDAKVASARRTVHELGSGDDFYTQEVLVPWARAEAKLAKPGEAPKVAHGFGFGDHSRATALPKTSARQWLRFRGLAAGGSRVVLVRFPPKGAPLGFLWSEPAEAPVQVTRAQLEGDGKPGPGRAWRAMVDGEGGPWRLTTGALLWRDAPLEDRGLVGRMIGRVVGNIVTYTYRGVLEDKATQRRLPGIFEVTLSED